ncbi:MAG: bifunctional diaminohydroxyphosphoribosylaminopyrimidine deaminase/5-amino-6-(5-phosphoribosylamino)uracil reductase RibD [Pseudomonadota bacterium]
MSDARWMASALALARRSLGRTWPNPAVGCLIVRDGRLLGRGQTAPGGRPHAETEALAQAADLGADVRGATAYVTLEPCAHHGRTPPCCDALIAAGIARVVCPLEDPDPRVAGRGFEALRAAGIEVDVGCMQREAEAVNAGFLSRIRRGRPCVTLKLALTLDGRIATRTGESRWITGPIARRRVHMMRADHDAVLIGAGTARADDPLLDIRDLGLEGRAPVRIVADGGLSLPLTGRLAATASQQPLWILHRDGIDSDRLAAFQDIGAETIQVPSDEDGLSIAPAMEALADRGITRLLCEGGGQIAATLIKAGLVDQLVVFSAGKIIGGDGLPGIRGFGLADLPGAPRFELNRYETIGEDTCSIWQPV